MSFVGTSGGVSLEIGDVGSFLNRFPNIEFLLAGLGAVSEVDGTVEASLATGFAVSSEAIDLSPKGMTGAATAREAIHVNKFRIILS